MEGIWNAKLQNVGNCGGRKPKEAKQKTGGANQKGLD